ncbi:hypothetical protein LC065_13300 [Halobacillus litoralis]|uniref:hypothetical protein n=1 Tax=Halobacillus litoralis TaxID=45668 RepID=UPI00273E78DE|nr:hypothetical protein [Halobacillus litoralis]WLR46544.1 hypothetical protein LC065_13300 [Halobacillus litoralis]
MNSSRNAEEFLQVETEPKRNPGNSPQRNQQEKKGAAAAEEEADSGRVIYIHHQCYEKMIAHCRRELPFEACGLFFWKRWP